MFAFEISYKIITSLATITMTMIREEREALFGNLLSSENGFPPLIEGTNIHINERKLVAIGKHFPRKMVNQTTVVSEKSDFPFLYSDLQKSEQPL